MSLDEAKRVIDRAWNMPPVAIDWNDVEEASMVIAAETGATYVPPYANDDVADQMRERAKAPPSSRGTPSGYNAGARRGGTVAGTGNTRPRYRGAPREDRAMRELLEHDERPPGWPG